MNILTLNYHLQNQLIYMIYNIHHTQNHYGQYLYYLNNHRAYHIVLFGSILKLFNYSSIVFIMNSFL